MAQNPPTSEILAKLRAEVAGGGDAAVDPPAPDVAGDAPDVAGEAPEVTTEPAAEPAPAAPKAAPASGATSDILAALRAEAKGGGGGPAAKPAAPAKPAAAAPAGGPAPTATNDILAALRAQSGKGGAPAASGGAKPAAPKKAATASIPEGEKPSVLEMIRAARGDAPAASAAAKTAPAKPVAPPPLPTKPPIAAKKKEPETRRNFLVAMVATPFAIAWSMFVATCAAATLGVARFMMPNVLVEPPSSFKVGPPSDFPPGTVSTKFKAQFGVWLVHAEFEGQSLIYALSTVCTHLGCTPNWLEGEQKFKCPCHGSGFYITGINFEGPAPRPLERHGIRVAPDGMIEVDKGRKFQQELGQWEDAASKVEVA